MVSYSVQAIDVSNERTKTSYLTSMVAEDLLSDKFSDLSGKKLYKYMYDDAINRDNYWSMESCSDGATTTTPNNVLEEKKFKWDNRFSKRRLKCDSNNVGKKELKIFEICKTCKYNNDDILEKIYFGKMKVTIKSSGTDSSGKQRKKTKLLYFQIN